MVEEEDLPGFSPESYTAGGDGWADGRVKDSHPETATTLRKYFASDAEKEALLKALSSEKNPHILEEDKTEKKEKTGDSELAGFPSSGKGSFREDSR